MSVLEIRNPWLPLDRGHVSGMEAAVGVYELRRDGMTFLIDYAGGSSRWGIRGALLDAVGRHCAGVEFRAEVVSTYLSRWAELMSVHRTRTGSFPVGNADHVPTIGAVGGPAR